MDIFHISLLKNIICLKNYKTILSKNKSIKEGKFSKHIKA